MKTVRKEMSKGKKETNIPVCVKLQAILESEVFPRAVLTEIQGDL